MWKLRLGLLVGAILAVAGTKSLWAPAIGRSLVCGGDVAPSDLIIVENFDPNYLLFERAAALQKAGFAPRALVPVRAPEAANPVSRGIAELMARQAEMQSWATVPVLEIEPISFTTTSQIRTRLAGERVRSLILVTSGLRSRRSALVYHAILDELDTEVYCAPVFGVTTPDGWTETWHGIQEVAQEFLKLQYYRFYVLPFFRRG